MKLESRRVVKVAKVDPLSEFRNSINEIKSKLTQAISWLYTHPEVWSSEFVDEARDIEAEIRELLDELIQRASEEAGSYGG